MAPRELIAFDALDKALSAGEAERAVDLFQADCYWCDLVTFT